MHPSCPAKSQSKRRGRPPRLQERNAAIIAAAQTMTLAAVSQQFGISRQRVHQICGSNRPCFHRRATPRAGNCKWCQREFYLPAKSKAAFCSDECVRQSRKKYYRNSPPRGGKWSGLVFVTLSCVHCGASFQRSNKLHAIASRNGPRNTFCSCTCANRFNMARRSTPGKPVQRLSTGPEGES